jgi:hypothetical protein
MFWETVFGCLIFLEVRVYAVLCEAVVLQGSNPSMLWANQSWNVRLCDTGGGESGTQTRNPGPKH